MADFHYLTMYEEICLLLPLPLQAIPVDPLAKRLQLIFHFMVTDIQVVNDLLISLHFHNAPSDSRVLLLPCALDALDLLQEILLLLVVILELNRVRGLAKISDLT
jgi:hypothetical protein